MTDRLTDEAARAIITLGTGPGDDRDAYAEACAGAARVLAQAEGPIVAEAIRALSSSESDSMFVADALIVLCRIVAGVADRMT
jgi:hypothetical protein